MILQKMCVTKICKNSSHLLEETISLSPFHLTVESYFYKKKLRPIYFRRIIKNKIKDFAVVLF
jgi:hypothetical protein